MNAAMFYGRKKTPARPIPDDSDDSELSSESESEVGATVQSPELSDSGSDEDDMPLADRFASSTWKKKPLAAVKEKCVPFSGSVFTVEDDVKLPIEYFRAIFDQALFDQIVSQSNLYAIQNNPSKPLGLTGAELEQFVGILFMMSIVRMPRARMYWSAGTRYEKVASVMPLRRFETVKRNIHCNDNAARKQDCTDKLYKLRPVVESLLSKFNPITPEEKLSIDEQVVPFKGSSSIKMYNPKKPKKWGYKIYVLSGVSGMVYNFEVHTGKIDACPNQPDLQASGNIVLRLLQPIARNVWHKVYFDNWFTSPKLLVTLHKQGIACLGTVRINRVPGCNMPSDADMKKEGRGSTVIQSAVIDGVELRALKWFDNRGVVLLTSYASGQPMSFVDRWDSKQKKKVQVQCPSAVVMYNQFMGGADLLDSLLALYRIPVRSKKWYHRLLWHFLDLSLVQSWLLYRREATANNVPGKEQLSLLQFKLSVAECLLSENKTKGVKRGRPSRDMDEDHRQKAARGPAAALPVTAVRTDGVSHWPIFGTKKGRCKLPGCKGIPKIRCEKCDVYLCFTTKCNCFKAFHQ